MKTHLSPFAWSVFGLFMATPLLILVARRAGNLCFYTLLLLALAAGICRVRPAEMSFFSFLRRHWILHLSMAGPLLAILINQVALRDFSARTFDYPTRMAFFFALAWIGLLLPWRLLRQLQWAFIAGAFGAAVKMYVITKGGWWRGYVDFMPIIEFAQLSQLLGFFAVLSVGFDQGSGIRTAVINILKFMAAGAGIYAAFLSQTRGAWVGIPLLIFIATVTLMRRFTGGRRIVIFMVLITGLGAAFFSSTHVRDRLALIPANMTDYMDHANPDTSVGVRLQLWKGSWVLFTEHPWVGVGREQFSNALGDLKRRGIITEAARMQPHSHDEFLYNLATLGIFGGGALLGLYLVPACYFLREWRHPDNEVRGIAGMGLVLSSGFMVLGLTDVMFMWGVSDNFYGIIAAILFAMLWQRKRYLAALEDEKIAFSAVPI